MVVGDLEGESCDPAFTAFVAERPQRRRTWAAPTFCPLSGCRAFGRSIAVSPTGAVTGCVALLSRADCTALQWRDQVPLQQWQARGAAVQARLRAGPQQQSRQERCRSCAERRLCGGGCPAREGCSHG
jgi:radical SAM protein with 4Fe4S-binding SPASM domain